MSKRIPAILALVGLFGAVAVVSQITWRGDRQLDAVSAVTEIHLDCSAYYKTTADILTRDGDAEIADQYRERADLALEKGADLSGRSLLSMMQLRNSRSVNMMRQGDADAGILGNLASLYDDECVALLDQQ